MNIDFLKQHFTQKELGSLLNKDQKTISNYFNNKTLPKEDDLIKIANQLNVSLDYLCNRPYNNNIGYIPDNKKDTIRKILELSDKNFDKLQGYITALSDSEK